MVPVPATAGGSPRAAPEAGAQLQGAERRARHQGTCGGRTPRPRGAAPPPRSPGGGEGGDARSGPGWAGSVGRGAVELSPPPSPELPARRRQDGALGTGSSGGPRGCHARARRWAGDAVGPPAPSRAAARGGARCAARGCRPRDPGPCTPVARCGVQRRSGPGPPGLGRAAWGEEPQGAAASGCCPEGTAALNRHRRGL